MPYVLLSAAIASEIAGTLLMNRSDGFSRLWPSLGTAVCYLVAFAFLAQTLKSLDVGVAYAIWSGAGTAVIAAIGMLFLGEAVTAARVGGVALVIAGVAVLNLGGAH
ncbi:multidrug efflux SMR transporter [Streptomyces sp. DSM 44917]|uniref:Multidrug efflux SMR transporter n=1 Tax=Streptomyces boetiae TaxID=3075541 RepID=A0ABU2L5A0_9ACTN|nr:multidrug efflux SMR transporter [Streptomyces sp. DSM 44917]MDT0306740.1 multidrug efflux SMR transporter [Streptomyces sp. DSM 44917]